MTGVSPLPESDQCQTKRGDRPNENLGEKKRGINRELFAKFFTESGLVQSRNTDCTEV
jgi:hypothetical protein